MIMGTPFYSKAKERVAEVESLRGFGSVRRVTGMVIEALCPPVFIGELCYLTNERLTSPLPCEVIAVQDNTALLMPFDSNDNVSVGTRV